MSPLDVVPGSESAFRMLYILPLALAYLFTQNRVGFILILCIFTLIAAIYLHGFLRAIIGPEAEDAIGVGDKTLSRRIASTIFADKPPYEYSARNPREIFAEAEKSPLRVLTFFYVIITGIFYLGSYTWTVH